MRKVAETKIKALYKFYFENHETAKKSAEKAQISYPTALKYIKADPRYPFEKIWRQNQAKLRRREQWRNYKRKVRQQTREQFDESYEIVKKEHVQAVIELSCHKLPSTISTYEFIKSAYVYERGKFIKKEVLETGTLVPYDLPKTIYVPKYSEGIKRKRNTIINAANNPTETL
ncbi:hypothetical protein [Anaerocellum danielii]|uniref:Transposase n=1 Tax=Anaerocellum danielii TaxID=1387557 RepID=A0ABZ0TXQ3_9FIRM|nr:hypothetical protein [Caldicellulosiruptor danielii]WPX08226.1 hypothetical protein SOJ16_002093 [Caldicellulosiruptor danielii]